MNCGQFGGVKSEENINKIELEGQGYNLMGAEGSLVMP